VFGRMRARRASVLKEIMEAELEGNGAIARVGEGLVGIEDDQIAQGYIALAGSGFGYITGKGTSGTQLRRYDQRERVQREYVSALPSRWRDMVMLLVEFLLQKRRP